MSADFEPCTQPAQPQLFSKVANNKFDIRKLETYDYTQQF